MIIARFIAALRGERRVCAIFVDGYTRGLSHTHACVPTRAYMCICRGYISHRRSSLYVNCIRNSEYPANFLHTDHSRISAKRTSIRRSLHHKFRRTWCNAAPIPRQARPRRIWDARNERVARLPRCCDSLLRPIHAFSVRARTAVDRECYSSNAADIFNRHLLIADVKPCGGRAAPTYSNKSRLYLSRCTLNWHISTSFHRDEQYARFSFVS